MEKQIIQLICAFIGSFGFGMLFNVRKKAILPGAFGGLLCWLVYLVSINFTPNIFVASIISSGFTALYSEILARFLKSPAIIFYIPAVVPLIPGSSLYYTMSSVVSGQWDNFRNFGLETVYFTFGIACGLSIVSAAIYILTRNKRCRKWGIVFIVDIFVNVKDFTPFYLMTLVDTNRDKVKQEREELKKTANFVSKLTVFSEDPNVPFYEKGGTVKRETVFLHKKIGTSVTCSDVAAGEGFEPSQDESESSVLPLHHPAIFSTDNIILQNYEKVKCFFKFFYYFVSDSRNKAIRTYFETVF